MLKRRALGAGVTPITNPSLRWLSTGTAVWLIHNGSGAAGPDAAAPHFGCLRIECRLIHLDHQSIHQRFSGAVITILSAVATFALRA